jgi:hypothetical protein
LNTGSRTADRIGWDGQTHGKDRLFFTLHPALVLRPFVLRLFALTPLANLHHLLICALSLIFSLTPFGWVRSIALTPYFFWKYHF